jgi:hypothetical protein
MVSNDPRADPRAPELEEPFQLPKSYIEGMGTFVRSPFIPGLQLTPY